MLFAVNFPRRVQLHTGFFDELGLMSFSMQRQFDRSFVLLICRGVLIGFSWMPYMTRLNFLLET